MVVTSAQEVRLKVQVHDSMTRNLSISGWQSAPMLRAADREARLNVLRVTLGHVPQSWPEVKSMHRELI